MNPENSCKCVTCSIDRYCKDALHYHSESRIITPRLKHKLIEIMTQKRYAEVSTE